MDFLESLDLDETHKKCHRVRSWYLYEQYKSLEKNQLDAAQKLKNKSYQDKILKQELKERRARRRLCDQFGSCHSESRLEKTVQSAPSKAPLSVSTDDLFESFCELHEENDLDDFEGNSSHDGSQTSKNFDVFRIVGNEKDDSDEESVKSVIKRRDENLTDDIRDELDLVKKNIADNINLQLETVKENIECLEKFTKLGDDDKISDIDLFDQCETDVSAAKARTKFDPKLEKRLLSTWSKLVTFAYKTVQLNHGNFYNDYSSQLMIAVLLCDVLRRGINKICHILQPYVSPIKYVTSDSDISEQNYNNLNRKKSIRCKRCRTHENTKHNSQNTIKSCRKLRWFPDREYQSEKKWQRHSKHNFDNYLNEMKLRGASEPWHSVPKFECRKSGGKCSSLWPEEFSPDKFSKKSICKCRCLKNVANPILKVARYIENILQDVESGIVLI